jgi:hypothetical protein
VNATDETDPRPLGSYVLLMATWSTAFGGFLLARSRRSGLPDALALRDLAVLGMATHKLSRTITRERVTAPVRAPFTRVEPQAPPGQVVERARGNGLRQALGYLLTCPYCTGPWVATALVCGMVTAPAATRLVSGVFAAVTVSDFLHQGFEVLSARTRALKAAAEAGTATAATR